MKLIDCFFTWILSIQNLLEKIEGWYRTRRKYVPWVYMSTFVIGVVLILLKLVMLSDGTLWEVQTALGFRCYRLPDCAVPELAADSPRVDRRLS